MSAMTTLLEKNHRTAKLTGRPSVGHRPSKVKLSGRELAPASMPLPAIRVLRDSILSLSDLVRRFVSFVVPSSPPPASEIIAKKFREIRAKRAELWPTFRAVFQ